MRRRKRTTRRCPPDKGPAEISSTVLLLGGWVPEANYTVRVKATEGVRTIFDLWTKLELLNKDEVVVKGENRGLASITGGQRQGVKLELL